MPFPKPYSKRRLEEHERGQPVTLVYDKLPEPFRVQVMHIWERALPVSLFVDRGDGYRPIWDVLEKRVAEEHGMASLGGASGYSGHNGYARACVSFITRGFDLGIDLIETSFRWIDSIVRYDAGMLATVASDPDDAIRDLNMRFAEHHLGYQFIPGSVGADGKPTLGQIVRMDSQYLHAEAVIPALTLLSGAGFPGPEEEFRDAQAKYRAGDHKGAITEATKAFESTLKAICDARGWAYDKTRATAKPLVDLVLANQLIPGIVGSGLDGLRSVLENFATPRNRVAAHGQGAEPKPVSAQLAAFVLHVAASSIVLFVGAHNTMP